MASVGDVVLFFKDGYPKEVPAIVVEVLDDQLNLTLFHPGGAENHGAPLEAGARGLGGATWRPKP